MIHFSVKSHVHRLVTVLSFVGEYPAHSLHLLGKERVLKGLVHRLTTAQTFRNDETGEEHTCRLLTITGKGQEKSIRFYKAGLAILGWVHPDAYGYYMRSAWNHRFPGDKAHRERHHRVAEAAVLCMKAGLEVRPYMLPQLQNRGLYQVVPKNPVFYLAKDIKRVGEAEMNKTMFTRMAGAVFSPGGCYAVYNTRASAMKWSGMGEFKALHSLMELSRMNAGVPEVDSAVLFGESYEVAVKTLLASEESKRLEFRFDGIYRHIYFIAMNEPGVRQLKLLMLPDWKRNMQEALFDEEELAFDKGIFEYDAYVDGVYVFSHLDSDLARLIRFREAVTGGDGRYEVVCYPHQLGFLREYLGDRVGYKTIGMELLEAALGKGGR